MRRALATNNIAPNIVSRDFRHAARKVLLTDITYLFFTDDRCYLSVIIDAFTHEVLGYQLSKNLRVDFVLDTVDQLISVHGSTLDNNTIVHSDQGCHYTSHAFIEKLKDAVFIQSMSRRGNCGDNAPQESFFGHMKDELQTRISACGSFEEVRTTVDDWMDYYNRDRYQWELLKLSPSEYFQYLQTGVYSLPVYDPKTRQYCRGSAPNPGV